MRIWHKDLIQYLPRQQLLGQWREVCLIARNIKENGTPNHVLVNKVMKYPIGHLWEYGYRIEKEMKKRGYKCDFQKFDKWFERNLGEIPDDDDLFYSWHEGRYLKQCLSNLQEKADCGAVPAEEWKRITERWPEYK